MSSNLVDMIRQGYHPTQGEAAALASELELAQRAIAQALDELGVPDESYPQPVANAVTILQGGVTPNETA